MDIDDGAGLPSYYTHITTFFTLPDLAYMYVSLLYPGQEGGKWKFTFKYLISSYQM